jgi:DNA-binding NtrC family response regulator
MTTTKKILVVDDEKNIRLTVPQALEPLGYFVQTACNGDDALRQLEGEGFDLILTDLKMPGMNGMELIKKAIALYPDIQIVPITAHATVDNAVEAMKLGAIDFLQKPFTPKELRDLVYFVLERETLNQKNECEYESSLELAKYCASKRKFDSAIAHLKKAIGVDPSRPEAFNLLGELQEASGNYPEALKNYKVAVDLDPTYQSAKDNFARNYKLLF